MKRSCLLLIFSLFIFYSHAQIIKKYPVNKSGCFVYMFCDHLNSNENTRGIVDYWKDKENNNWKVKAWTDGKFIAVLYAYTKTEVPDKADVFLNSLRFPGM